MTSGKEKRSINKILQIGIDNLLFDELMFPSSNMIPIIWPYTTFFDIFDILDCYIRWCYLVGVCTYYQHISFQNPPMKKIITFWKHPVHQRRLSIPICKILLIDLFSFSLCCTNNYLSSWNINQFKSIKSNLKNNSDFLLPCLP
jgi:hypothetical protein